MIVKQRQIVIVQDVSFDEATDIGRYEGAYYSGDFAPIDAAEVFDRYLHSGLRIPDEFIEVRAILDEKIALLKG